MYSSYSLDLIASTVKSESAFDTSATTEKSDLFFILESDCSIVVPVKIVSS